MEYSRLEQTIKSLNYKWFNNSVNIIGERTNDIFTDFFTDYIHIAVNNQVHTFPASTKAGILYVKNPLSAYGTNVKTGVYENIKGVAVLKEGQYRNCYQLVDNYWQWLSYPYLYQVGAVDVYRDNTLDLEIDRDSPVHRGCFGINIHRGSNPGILGYNVGSFSAGCQVIEEPNLKQILSFLRQDVIKFGNLFTYTLIKTEDLVY